MFVAFKGHFIRRGTWWRRESNLYFLSRTRGRLPHPHAYRARTGLPPSVPPSSLLPTSDRLPGLSHNLNNPSNSIHTATTLAQAGQMAALLKHSGLPHTPGALTVRQPPRAALVLYLRLRRPSRWLTGLPLTWGRLHTEDTGSRAVAEDLNTVSTPEKRVKRPPPGRGAWVRATLTYAASTDSAPTGADQWEDPEMLGEGRQSCRLCWPHRWTPWECANWSLKDSEPLKLPPSLKLYQSPRSSNSPNGRPGPGNAGPITFQRRAAACSCCFRMRSYLTPSPGGTAKVASQM